MSDTPSPSEDDLRRLIEAGEQGEIDELLQADREAREGCQERLERITDDSATIDAIRGALTTEVPGSSRLLETIERLSQRGVASVVDTSPSYDDLQPWIDSSHEDGKETLDGYVLRACIGRGGMGLVFEADDVKLGHVVALKVMRPDLAREDQARERFLREGRAIAAVRHPNVVALHHVSEVDGLPYLVMEYVEGDSLDARTQNGTQMPVEEIVRIGAAVAAGLAACHEQGVIHRDIKPSNVLLGKDGAVKVSDFGLAAVASTRTLTHDGYLSGTPDYVAPERLSIGSAADERSDLFSLGCLLYTMATGEEPFGGDTPLITLHRIATDDPARVRAKNPSIPLPLEETISALMEKRPEDRPASAEAARALLLGGKVQRRRAVNRPIGVAGVVVLLSAVGLGFFTWFSSRPDASPRGVAEYGPGEAGAPDTPEAGKIVVTTAAGLERAVDEVADHGVIEIDTDGLLEVDPLYIDFRSVTITAAAGRRPVIRLKTADGATEGGAVPAYLLRLNYGTLTLVGVELQDAWERGEHSRLIEGRQGIAEDFSLLSLIDADLVVRDCRLKTETEGACLRLEPANDAELHNTQLLAPFGTAVIMDGGDEDGLTLSDCLLIGNAALVLRVEGKPSVAWRRSVVLSNIATLEMIAVRGQLTAEITDCVIQSAQALVLSTLYPPSLEHFQQRLAWQGSGNRVRGQEVILSDGDYAPSWGREIASWAVSDHSSVYGKQLFTISHHDVVARLMEGEVVESLMLSIPSR
ncbi:MAG: serine/threonine-protein kinase [Planctomycetota bacterium]